MLPAVYGGAYEEKHEGYYGENMSADGNRRPVQSAGGCLFLSPVLVAGNNWEMIHRLARVPGTTH